MAWWERAAFAVCVILLIGWSVFGVLGTIDLLATDCARAASEVSDPCAVGRGAFFLFSFLAWCVVAIPLVFLCGALRPPRR